MSNHLPLRVSKGATDWNFEWDDDALIAQAKEGLPEDMEALYVGCLPVEVDPQDQDVSIWRAQQLCNCILLCHSLLAGCLSIGGKLTVLGFRAAPGALPEVTGLVTATQATCVQLQSVPCHCRRSACSYRSSTTASLFFLGRS